MIDLYRNNLKNRSLAASGLPQNSCSHSRLASRQWSLAPSKNSEAPLCRILDSSSCFGISRPITISSGDLSVGIKVSNSGVVVEIACNAIQNVPTTPKHAPAKDIVNTTSIRKTTEGLLLLKSNYEKSIHNLTEINRNLEQLYSNRPTDLSDWAAYEQQLQRLLAERAEKIQNLKQDSGTLRATTTHKLRRKFQNRYVILPGYATLQEWHRDAKKIHELTGPLASGNNRLLEESRKNELYSQEALNFRDSYEIFQNLCEKLSTNSDLTTEQRAALQDQLQPLKTSLETQAQRLANLSGDTTMQIGADWDLIKNNLQISYERVKNLANEVAADLPAAYLETEAHIIQQIEQFHQTYQEILESQDRSCDLLATDEERAAFKTKLEISKTNFDQIRTKLNQVIPIEQLNQTYEDAQFYTRTESENLSELDQLFQQSSQEYFHKSALYQHKLLRQGKADSVIRYGQQWMATAPQEARWETILQMTELFQRGARPKTYASDWEGYRTLLNTWVQKRPDLRELHLVQGHLYRLDHDLSFPAAESYSRCEASHPDQPVWKRMGTLCDVSSLQWSQAKAKLEHLPEESAAVVRHELAQSEYATYTFGTEVFSHIALSVAARLKAASPKRSLASGVLNTAAHLLSDPNFVHWSSLQLIDYPETLQKTFSKPSKQSIAWSVVRIGTHVTLGPILDAIAPNRELRQKHQANLELPAAAFLDLVPRAMNAYQLYQKAQWTPLLANIGYSIPSAISYYDAYNQRQRSPNTRAALRTWQQIVDDVLPLNILSANASIIQSIGKQLAIQCNAQGLFVKTGAVLAKASAVAPSSQIMRVTLIAGYRFAFDYPQIRAACTIEDAIRLGRQGKQEEVAKLLDDAQKWRWGNSGAVKAYADCIEFLELVPTLETTSAIQLTPELIANVNLALHKFKKSKHYSYIYNYLLSQKVIAYLKIEDFETAKHLLTDKNLDSAILEQTVVFVAFYAKSLDNSAENYLQQAATIFSDATYSTILLKYKEYISCCGSQPALTEEEVTKRVDAITAVEVLIESRVGLSQLHESLQNDKILLFVDTNRLGEANALLPHANASVHRNLAYHLIQQINVLFHQEKYAEIENLLERSQAFSPFFKYHDLCARYGNYCFSKQQNPSLTEATPPLEILNQTSAIRSIIKLIESIEDFSQLRLEMRFKLLCAYIDTKNYGATNDLLAINPSSGLHAPAVSYVAQKVHVLHRERGHDDALSYLIEATEQITEFQHIELLLKYRTYLAYFQQGISSEALANEWLSSVDALRQEIQPIGELHGLYLDLQHQKFSRCLADQRYPDIQLILNQIDLDPQIRAIFVNRLAAHLVERAERLRSQESIDTAKDWFHQTVGSFGINENRLATRYFRFLVDTDNALTQKDSIDLFLKAIESVDKTLKAFSLSNQLAPDSLRQQKVRLYLDLGGLQERANQIQNAIGSYSSARSILSEEERSEHEWLTHRIQLLTTRLEAST